MTAEREQAHERDEPEPGTFRCAFAGQEETPKPWHGREQEIRTEENDRVVDEVGVARGQDRDEESEQAEHPAHELPVAPRTQDSIEGEQYPRIPGGRVHGVGQAQHVAHAEARGDEAGREHRRGRAMAERAQPIEKAEREQAAPERREHLVIVRRIAAGERVEEGQRRVQRIERLRERARVEGVTGAFAGRPPGELEAGEAVEQVGLVRVGETEEVVSSGSDGAAPGHDAVAEEEDGPGEGQERRQQTRGSCARAFLRQGRGARDRALRGPDDHRSPCRVLDIVRQSSGSLQAGKSADSKVE